MLIFENILTDEIYRWPIRVFDLNKLNSLYKFFNIYFINIYFVGIWWINFYDILLL